MSWPYWVLVASWLVVFGCWLWCIHLLRRAHRLIDLLNQENRDLLSTNLEMIGEIARLSTALRWRLSSPFVVRDGRDDA